MIVRNGTNTAFRCRAALSFLFPDNKARNEIRRKQVQQAFSFQRIAQFTKNDGPVFSDDFEERLKHGQFQTFHITFNKINPAANLRNNSSPYTFFTFSDSTYSRKCAGPDHPGISKFLYVIHFRNAHFHIIRIRPHRILIKGDIVQFIGFHQCSQGVEKFGHGLNRIHMSVISGKPAQFQGKISEMGADINAIVPGRIRFFKK